MAELAQKRVLDTRAYLDGILSALPQAGKAAVAVSGSSMLPFLAEDRDFVILSPLEGAELKRGEIALYCRGDGSYVLHRVWAIEGGGTYSFLGDAQREIERGVPQGALRAKAVAVKRKGRLYTEKSLLWRFYAHIWPRLRPLWGLVRGCRRRL